MKRKSRIHVRMVMTGYVDVEHYSNDPAEDYEWCLDSPEDLIYELDDVVGQGVITKIESLDPPLIQLAGESE